ncbi:hypothetical protein Lgee_2150 [Legionella geestiana]|uniref:Uncharacterized protein n=1 Tax=Legionella geestiana TaxID=45065 RepID=A0A0W0TLM8_9GAMM|nr:ankyrin repeat domain-containing protein [Legionella geestiana]KTC96467.1 hypothetical protein Lgee_2150 [Legionella geestiana]QBS12510.1 ankyrin repeat domain-containing protein [Legionella geestiana]STX55045.1 Uncharacterised protein [Legionella geestiana]
MSARPSHVIPGNPQSVRLVEGAGEKTSDFVINFFQNTRQIPNGIELFHTNNQLIELYQLILRERPNGELAATPEIRVDDEVLQAWCKEGVLEASTYRINRILLHALCYPQSTWSPVFRENFHNLLSFIVNQQQQPHAYYNPAIRYFFHFPRFIFPGDVKGQRPWTTGFPGYICAEHIAQIASELLEYDASVELIFQIIDDYNVVPDGASISELAAEAVLRGRLDMLQQLLERYRDKAEIINETYWMTLAEAMIRHASDSVEPKRPSDEVIRHFFDALSVEDANKAVFTALKQQDSAGAPLLFLAARSPRLLNGFLSKLNRLQLDEVFALKRNSGDTILHAVAKLEAGAMIEALSVVLRYMKGEDISAALASINNMGENVLLLALHEPRFVSEILPFLEPEQLAGMAMQKNRIGESVVDSAINQKLHFRTTRNLDSLMCILDKMSNENVTAIVMQNPLLLQIVIENPDYLARILTRLPEDERLGAVRNLLTQAAKEFPDSLRCILQLLPASDRWNAVFEPYANGRNLLMSSLEANFNIRENAVSAVLESLTDEQVALAATQPKNVTKNFSWFSTETVLHNAVNHSQSLALILARMNDNQIAGGVAVKDSNGDTVLHRAVDKPKSLQLILSRMPPLTKVAALSEEDRRGSNVVHEAVANDASLKVMVDNLSPEELEESVMVRDLFGQTVLDVALEAGTSSSFTMTGSRRTTEAIEPLATILSGLHEATVARLARDTANGDSLLYRAVPGCPQSLKRMLLCIPENERLDAVRQVGRHGITVAQKAKICSQTGSGREKGRKYYEDIQAMLPPAAQATLDNEINEVVKPTPEGSRERHYFDALLAYTQRIAGYSNARLAEGVLPNPFMINTNAIRFDNGFFVRADSRAINRRLNYLMAKDLMLQLNAGQSVADVLGGNNIQHTRQRIIDNPSNRLSDASLTIRSFELNRILSEAADEIAHHQVSSRNALNR